MAAPRSNFFDDYIITPENQPAFFGTHLAAVAKFNNGFLNPLEIPRLPVERGVNSKSKVQVETLRYLLSDVGFGIFGAGQDWRPVRVLGQGEFGKVSHYQRTDEDGLVEEEIALKETLGVRRSFEIPNNRGLPKEAVYTHLLNERGCQNVINLRKYSYYPTSIEGTRKYRMYLEFAHFGDLEELRARYAGTGRHLPELFLWHLFHAFANVALEMSQGVWQDYSQPEGVHKDGSFMLHFDLKPANIVLGQREEMLNVAADTDPDVAYPKILITDLGLAEIIHKDDQNNSREFFGNGTPDFKPPVRMVHSFLESNYLLTFHYRNRDISASNGIRIPKTITECRFAP